MRRALAVRNNGLCEIDLGNRRHIRLDAYVDQEVLARALDVLVRQ
jgi:transposase